MQRINLLVIDENFDKCSFEFLNKICIENNIPLLVSDTLSIRKNMSKYNFPINLTPVLNVNYDFEDIIITYSSRDKFENIIMTKLMTFEPIALNKIFDDFREFINKLRIQKMPTINNLKTKKPPEDQKVSANENGNKQIHSKLSEDSLNELDSAFEDVFSDNLISNTKLIRFLNRLDSIIEKYEIQYHPEDLKNNKIHLEKYMFPVLKFDEFEKKIYIDQISINLKYQAYVKAKSKNKVVMKEFDIEHIIHIINTFSKSLNTILNFSLYSTLREMKENNVDMPYIINFYGRLFSLNSIKKTSEKISDGFEIKFTNYPAFDEKHNEICDYHQLKNSFFGYSYMNENKLISYPKKKYVLVRDFGRYIYKNIGNSNKS